MTTNIFATGVPFYVQARDTDWLLPICSQGLNPVYGFEPVLDGMEYKWVLTSSEANIGTLVGSDENAGSVSTAAGAAIVFRPNQQLPKGPYTASISVTCRDLGLATRFDDPESSEPVLTWTINFDVVDGCVAILKGLAAPNRPNPTGGPVTLTPGTCCATGSEFSRGAPIALEYNRIPAAAVTGRYTVLDVRHRDFDHLMVKCEDLVSQEDCQDSGVEGSYGPFDAGDPLTYSWTCQLPSGAPGALPVPNATEHAVIFFTPELGSHQVCVTVRDSGQGPDECQRIVQTVTASDLPLLIIGDGPMTYGASVLLNAGCDAIRLYVNDDDDGQRSPPQKDNAHVDAIAGEDDMYHVNVASLIAPTSGQTVQVRFRVLGDPTFRVFAQSNHSQLWGAPPNSEWLSLPSTGIDVWLEGLRANTQVNGSQLAVDLRFSTAEGWSSFTTQVDCTVFGITNVSLNTVADPTPNGYGHVTPWNDPSVKMEERPDHLKDRGDVFFIEPDPRIPTDTLVAGGWDYNRRNEVHAKVTVTPAAPGVRVHVRSMDVDDNSLPERENNYVDDTPAEGLAAFDNVGLIHPDPDQFGESDLPSRHGVVRKSYPATSRAAYSVDVTTGQDAFPAPLGEVHVFVRTTYGMGDNFRVLATLSPHNEPAWHYEAPANIMSPGPRLSAAPDYVTSPLAYSRSPLLTGMGYVGIPAGALPDGSQTRSSHVFTVRRVVYVEEEFVNGVAELNGMLEGYERGMRRMVGHVSPYAPNPPGPSTHLRLGCNYSVPQDAYKKRDWQEKADESPNLSSTFLTTLTPGTEFDAPPDSPIPDNIYPLSDPDAGVFKGTLQGGKMRLFDAAQTNIPIDANGSTEVLVPMPASIPVRLVHAGAVVHVTTLQEMTPVDATTGTTSIVLADAAPDLVDQNTSVEISGVSVPLHATTQTNGDQTVLYLSVANWQFPCMLYGEDEQWGVMSPALQSEIDLVGHLNGQTYSLVNHYLRNFPMRVKKLPAPYSAVWPLGPASGATRVQRAAFFDMVRSLSKTYTDGLYSEERLWVVYSFTCNEMEPLVLMPEGPPLKFDGDPDMPVSEYPLGAIGPDWEAVRYTSVATGEMHHVDVEGHNTVYAWIQSTPESCREFYKALSSLDWSTQMFPQRGANHRDTLRARVFAHELLHMFEAQGANQLPARGEFVPVDLTNIQLLNGIHTLPGIVSPFETYIKDNATGDWMQTMPNFATPGPTPDGAPRREADVPSHVIWFARTHVLYPMKLR